MPPHTGLVILLQDNECAGTLENMYHNADNPNRVYVGAVTYTMPTNKSAVSPVLLTKVLAQRQPTCTVYTRVGCTGVCDYAKRSLPQS